MKPEYRGIRTMRKAGRMERTRFPAFIARAAVVLNAAGGHNVNGRWKMVVRAVVEATVNDRRHEGL
jgi:hypothetical protein